MKRDVWLAAWATALLLAVLRREYATFIFAYYGAGMVEDHPLRDSLAFFDLHLRGLDSEATAAVNNAVEIDGRSTLMLMVE